MSSCGRGLLTFRYKSALDSTVKDYFTKNIHWENKDWTDKSTNET